MVRKKTRGQSTLEYILVLTAIIGVMIWAAATLVKPKVEQGFGDVQESIQNTATQIAAPVTGGGGGGGGGDD